MLTMMAFALQGLGSDADLIRLIIWVLLLGCLLWAIRWALAQTALPAAMQNIVLIIVALLLLLVVLSRFGVL